MEESSNGGFVSLSNFNDSLSSLMSNLPILTFQFNFKPTEKLIKNKNYSGMSHGLKIWGGLLTLPALLSDLPKSSVFFMFM